MPYDIIISHWHVRSQTEYTRYGWLVGFRHAGKQGHGKLLNGKKEEDRRDGDKKDGGKRTGIKRMGLVGILF